MILTNGKIYTGNNNFCEALRITGHYIEAVGNNDEILSLKNKDDEIIDLNGKLVLPGFIDSHIHMLNYGFTTQMFNMYHLTSIDQMIDEGRDFLETESLYQDQWLLGRGWNQDYFKEGRFPTFQDLDKISSNLPIYFSRTCGHMAVLNSKGLDLLKENNFSHEHLNWETGQVFEEAILEVFKVLPKPTKKGIKNMLLRAQKDFFESGITSVHSDDLASLPQSNPKLILDAFEELKDEGLLKLSVYEQCLLPSLENLKDFKTLGLSTGDGDEYFKIGPLKLLVDGSLGARTALMSDPYVGTDEVGIGLYTQDELNVMMDTAKSMGMQIACHGIGDGAMALILNSYRHIETTKDDRHGIVHCQISNKSTFEDMKAMGIHGYIQPIFIDYDMHIVEERVGLDRMKMSYNWKTLLDNDIPISGGSDAPVVGFDVFENIYSAVTRKDLKGYPEGGWLPNQKLSKGEALDLFTLGGAFSAFEEDKKGKVKEGFLADLIIINQDYFEVEEDDIKNLKVDITIAKGEIVYERNQ